MSVVSRITLLLSWFTLCIAVQPTIAKEPKTLLGDWVLNVEETERLKPKLPKAKKSSSGFGSRAQVGLGGVIVTPTGGNRAQSKNVGLPLVLSCVNLNLKKVGEEVHMLCDNESDPRRFKIGKHHGRKVKWTTKKLTEGYTSTSRRVEHEFFLKKERMHVEVMVKPKSSKRLRYLAVFDRPNQETES